MNQTLNTVSVHKMTINITIYVILSIIGIFLAAWLHHFFAKKRDSKKTFNMAANEFSNAFREFVAMLDSGFNYEKSGACIDIPFPDHSAAAIEFRRHLGWFRRKCFDRKLTQYKLAAEQYDDEVNKCFGLKNVSHETNLKLLKRINSLLKYSNPK